MSEDPPKIWPDYTNPHGGWRWCGTFQRSDEDQGRIRPSHGWERTREEAQAALERYEARQALTPGRR